MEIKSTGVWHIVYVVLLAVFLLVVLAFGGSVSSALKADDRALASAVAVIAFVLMVVVISFWWLAAVNASAIRRHYQSLIDEARRDGERRVEEQTDHEEALKRSVVISFYEMACEFLSRFSDHYILMAAEHSEKKWNRRSFWLVIVYITSIANQIEALGDTHRARAIRNLLERELTAVQVGIDDGSGWAELKNAALLVVVAGKMSVKSAPIEYLEVARSTRLVEYVIDFTPAGS